MHSKAGQLATRLHLDVVHNALRSRFAKCAYWTATTFVLCVTGMVITLGALTVLLHGGTRFDWIMVFVTMSISLVVVPVFIVKTVSSYGALLREDAEHEVLTWQQMSAKEAEDAAVAEAYRVLRGK